MATSRLPMLIQLSLRLVLLLLRLRNVPAPQALLPLPIRVIQAKYFLRVAQVRRLLLQLLHKKPQGVCVCIGELPR